MLALRAVAALVMYAAGPRASADTYITLDVNAAIRTGPYRWSGPPGMAGNDPTPLTVRTHVTGPGITTHLAIGAAVTKRTVVAGELGLGQFFVGSGMQYSGPWFITLARLGVRAEALVAEHAFVRGALGYELFAMGGGGLDVGARENVWQPETTGGPWASLSGGLRGRRLGGLARVDVGRATFQHAVYWPITFSLGLDVTWR